MPTRETSKNFLLDGGVRLTLARVILTLKKPKAGKHTYEYARKALMVDAVVLGLVVDQLRVLLIRRKEKPYVGKWALPGGHVEVQETVEEAVHRELFEETNIKNTFLEQLHVFSELDRDPREPTVSVAFYGLVRPESLKLKAGTDADLVGWFPLYEVPRIAFDHGAIIEMALQRLKQEIWARPIMQALMPEVFTMRQLYDAYQQLLQDSRDPKNFRRDILKKGFLEEAEDLRPRWQQDRMPINPRIPTHYRFNP